MNHRSTTDGIRIVAQFDDDASNFSEAESEIVPISSRKENTTTAPSDGLNCVFLASSEEASVAAKRFWLKVIRRHAEPVPDKKGRLRVRDAEEPNRGVVKVEYGRPSAKRRGRHKSCSGCELDVTDKTCLTIFARDDEDVHRTDGKSLRWIKETIIPIPWTELAEIRFEINRPLPELRTQQPASA
jgi:hypothetical protein